MSIKKFYKENGFVVVKDLVPSKQIDDLLKVFTEDIIKNKKIRLPLMDKQEFTKPLIINNKLQNPIGNPHCLKFLNKNLEKFNKECLKVMLTKKYIFHLRKFMIRKNLSF